MDLSPPSLDRLRGARRPRGTNLCPGPHEKPRLKQIGHRLCTPCWKQLPGETRGLLRAGVPAGASERRWTVAKERLAAGTPLEQLRIDDVPVDDLYLTARPEGDR